MHRLDLTVGRQSVHDVDGARVGHSLRFRGGGRLAAGAQALRQNSPALMRAALAVGLDTLAGEGDVYFTVGVDVLDGSVPVITPPERSILLVESDVVPDEEVVDGARRLVARGYRLGVEYDASTPSATELRSLASIIKIDMGFAAESELPAAREIASTLQARLLAYRVPNPDAVATYAAHGVDLVQGATIGATGTETVTWLEPVSRTVVERLTELITADAPIADVADALRGDLALTVHVLSLATRLSRGTAYRIASIEDAVRHVGLPWVTDWLAVLDARAMTPGVRLHDEVVSALMRARACELLAPGAGASEAFTAGLLSDLGPVFDEPVEHVLGRLALAPELLAAATGTGPLAELLGAVTQAQRTGRAPAGTYPAAEVEAALAQAFHWALDRVDGVPV